jgi:hypothetical protein
MSLTASIKQLPLFLLAGAIVATALSGCAATPAGEQPEVFCRRETMTGSNIPKSTCRTREEMKRDQENIDRMRDELKRAPSGLKQE